jgi:hypothetical protein
MLTVIEHKQQIPFGQIIFQRVKERAAGLLTQSEGRCHYLRQQRWIRKRRQLHQPCTVLKILDGIRGNL